MYKEKSVVTLYCEVGRALERILDSELNVFSAFYLQNAELCRRISNPQFASQYEGASSGFDKRNFPTLEFLDCIKFDLVNDICLLRPLSGIHYPNIALRFINAFADIELELGRIRNPLWIRICEQRPETIRHKSRIELLAADAEEDRECTVRR